VRLLDLGVESAHVVEELEGEVVADLFGQGLRRDLRHQPLGVRNVEFLGNCARYELGQERMEPTDHPGPVTAEVHVALCKQPKDLGVVGRFDAAQARGPKGSYGERASLGSFLLERPVASTLMREAKVAGTSITSSPRATSCWANK
jgi:hypothetical protein